ncbi:MAG: hypothetical protein KAX49_04840 [Halanaerobiales bacterium]|nr:hypothetical protein [Halanaerobiales bacterium]
MAWVCRCISCGDRKNEQDNLHEGAQPLSYWIFGAMVDVFSVYMIFLICSFALLALSLAFYKFAILKSDSFENGIGMG